ncbi:MAG TPA: shikimate dehydrogenase [Mitsuokella multacida]|nr:shikimate dehydrogenase [Mitsuokella multacida]
MNAGYKHIELSPIELEVAIEGIRVLQFVGVNVTIPYKQTVMPYLDEITPEATRIGAVNTIKVKEGKLYGANTDYYGFGTMLASHSIAVENQTAMVLGFGGSAKAVVLYLLDNGINNIIIVSRKKGALTDIPDDPRISLMSYDEITDISGDLIINTTPLGMYPHVEGMPPVDWTKLKKDALVYDIIYTPERTRFLREAQEHGHAIINGEGMLAGQGAAAFTLWTGVAPDIALMKRALREELASRQGK